MYLIVNLGLKSIRMIVFNSSGSCLYSDSLPVHTSLQGDKVEQDVVEWKSLLFRLLDGLEAKTKFIPQIENITCTTSSSCFFGYDENMEPITKALMVSDKRSSEEVTFIKENLSFIEEVNGESLSCTDSSSIPKLLWYKNNLPKIFKRIKYWLGANEFLNYEFTGEVVTDPLNASKSFYSDKSKDYLKNIFEDISVSPNLLPRVTEIGTTLNLTQKILRSYSFNKHCKYVVTTYDAICAVIGSFSGYKGDICDVSGTVTSVRTLVKKTSKRKKHNEILLRQNIPIIDQELIGCSNNLGGGIIEWYKQTFFHDMGNGAYAAMEDDASKSTPGANGLIFLPYLLGERAPFIDKNIRGSFFGINRDSKRKDFTKAVFESTAFATNSLIELLKNDGIKVEFLSLSGGLARLDLINQIKSDVTNLPVKVIENFESTSLGAFILMRMALGHFSSLNDAVSELVTIRKIIYPNKKNIKVYSEAFSLFKEMTKLNSSISFAHQQFSKKIGKHSSITVNNL